ncbi:MULTISPECIES: DUF2017 family protein [Trueperella]|uniref:DUF2017 family protein n=1 Tax=Trueperella bernardiae TaxID=59561 RepID=A0AAW6ZKN7_9ACTO|nr:MULTISPECIES: DUF2017 family protein [Trueperella]MCM3908217.1 DUF2017 domain-containing protein [Trueperella bernardiae]MDK8601963.1 DUF2017 family protein [Trueperella bernardiae]MDV6239569.1 DUF2017 family protein [Trueperella bernardiae]OFS71954.1 hypothetical protein HMPREF3167_09085 [Trueperella sp. HMSC08B05]WIM07274.1 DUF2017 family protein [Trueperella bernardiae]
MLTAFRIARGGYLAHIDDDERRVLAGLVKDAVYLLGSDVEHEAERRSQTVDPDDPLAELEADVVDIADAIAAEGEPRARAPYDVVVEHLLPDMSEDPDEAKKLRELTETSVASQKIENLVTVYLGLESARGSGDVLVANEDAPAWMSALNDVRLVLAARLGIDDDAASRAVEERVRPFHSGDTDAEPSTDDVLAIVYSMSTWWQDSLVTAVRNKALRR